MLEANDMDPSIKGDPEFNEECRIYTNTWQQNNSERILGYYDKFRESARLDYHKKKQAAKDHCNLNRKDYENMNIRELQYLGKNRNIKYIHSMPKIKLIVMLKINDEDPSIKSDPEFDRICRETNLIKGKKHREKISREKAQNQ